ncbi:MAG: hypothetical protein BWK73_32905 [Thiothrix lacustris]|uniref:Uncharacterized protein n=1 Tax=Thiothrix lacustris TaxID=525917 RepID=A0A1Y1QHU6_9GAMM|nr:MAG: hypothetical protein BWK73_32905 [Thiothrix lacustris]
MKLQDTLNQLGNESWALFNLASIGRKAALNEVVEVVELTYLLETLEKRLEALHDTIHALEYSAVVRAASAIQQGGAA